MRIVGGTFRGRNLAGPAGTQTRPTSDRVREAIFNILAHNTDVPDLAGARVMDLFAGTGAMGLEALSRGARFCQFVDDAGEARGVIRKNADTLGVVGLCKIWRRDATQLGDCAPQTPYDIVFCDPPYGRQCGEASLRALVDGGWLAAQAVVVLEEGADATVEPVPGLSCFDQRQYGETQALFFKVG